MATKLTANFNLEEFACKDGTPVPEKFMDNVKLLAKNLQVLRTYIGEPLHINSAFRTAKYNKKVGGKENSTHLKAMAADITCKSLTPHALAFIIKKLIKSGEMIEGGIGEYKGFVHYDVRGWTARWKG